MVAYLKLEIRDRGGQYALTLGQDPPEELVMTVIEIPDEQAAALKAKAAAQGFTLETWLKKMAEGGTGEVFGMSSLDWSQCPAVESVPGKCQRRMGLPGKG